ncbi:MAG: hypothetical protein ACK4V6_08565 [Microthrixaceae bacterium]
MQAVEDSAAPSAPRLRWWIMAVLTISLVLIGGLRFARMDVLGTSFFAVDRYYTFETDEGRDLENLNIDIVQYLSMIEDRRGVDDAFEKQEPYQEFAETGEAVEGPVSPFIHRPALPWIASWLPFDSAAAFAVTNLVLVVAGLWFLVDALRVRGRSPRAQLFGGVLYTFALPVLVFTSSLYIDGGAMAVFVFGYWLIARRAWWAVVAFIPLSYLVKEALLALAPAAAWAWHLAGHRFRSARFALGASIAAIGWIAVAATVSATAPDPVFSFSVMPKLVYLGGNLGNPTSTLFFILGLGPVVLPALLLMWNDVRSVGVRGAFLGPSGSDTVGFCTLVLINVYSMVSTDLTLRTGWLIFPFAIGLSARWLDQVVDDDRAPAWTRSLGAVWSPRQAVR